MEAREKKGKERRGWVPLKIKERPVEQRKGTTEGWERRGRGSRGEWYWPHSAVALCACKNMPQQMSPSWTTTVHQKQQKGVGRRIFEFSDKKKSSALMSDFSKWKSLCPTDQGYASHNLLFLNFISLLTSEPTDSLHSFTYQILIVVPPNFYDKELCVEWVFLWKRVWGVLHSRTTWDLYCI